MEKKHLKKLKFVFFLDELCDKNKKKWLEPIYRYMYTELLGSLNMLHIWI